MGKSDVKDGGSDIDLSGWKGGVTGSATECAERGRLSVADSIVARLGFGRDSVVRGPSSMRRLDGWESRLYALRNLRKGDLDDDDETMDGAVVAVVNDAARLELVVYSLAESEVIDMAVR